MGAISVSREGEDREKELYKKKGLLGSQNQAASTYFSDI
jgi:hypothetical protein